MLSITHMCFGGSNEGESGCKAEASQLRTADRLVNLIAVLAILSWRIFWMTMMNRAALDSTPEVALSALEVKLLDQLVREQLGDRFRNRPLSTYITKLERLGGYLACFSDPPPGNMLVWRDLSRHTDIQLGFLLVT